LLRNALDELFLEIPCDSCSARKSDLRFTASQALYYTSRQLLKPRSSIAKNF
jgi:hypothetical protein